MIQMFAKEYKESITLAYYCGNLLLTIVVFTVGTIYLWHRDRRDQQRRIREDREYQERRDQEDRRDQQRRLQEDREYQERRDQEDRRDQQRRLQEDREYQKRRDQEDRRDHQRREWRQFAERIYTDYSKLKSKDIPQKISKVKNTFERILIHSTVTGLDVLRYMLADDNYRNFSSESPQLRALREDLHMIFLPLNICSSLLLLGEVPENIKEEIRIVVEELGNVAKPFFSGKQRNVASKCLEHFGSTGSSNAAATENDEIRVSEDTVPYINLLQFGGPSDGVSQGNFMDECDYSKCAKFSINLKGKIIMGNSDKNLTFLIKLHTDLEDKALEEDFVRIQREQLAELPAGSRLWISDNDNDEVILTKVLHEVRLHIHHTLCENLPSIEADRMDWLREVYKKVKEFYPTKQRIKDICSEFISSLQNIKRETREELINNDFLEKFEELYRIQFGQMIQRATVSRTPQSN